MKKKPTTATEPPARAPMRTPMGNALTELVLTVLSTSATLQDIGPAITQDPKIVAVRWRILSAVSGEAKTAAELGRDLGVSRQAALMNVRSLEELGYVALLDNPDDQRAMKVGLTDQGAAKLQEVSAHQARWVNALARHFRGNDIAAALATLRRLDELARQSVAQDGDEG